MLFRSQLLGEFLRLSGGHVHFPVSGDNRFAISAIHGDLFSFMSSSIRNRVLRDLMRRFWPFPGHFPRKALFFIQNSSPFVKSNEARLGTDSARPPQAAATFKFIFASGRAWRKYFASAALGGVTSPQIGEEECKGEIGRAHV